MVYAVLGHESGAAARYQTTGNLQIWGELGHSQSDAYWQDRLM